MTSKMAGNLLLNLLPIISSVNQRCTNSEWGATHLTQITESTDAYECVAKSLYTFISRKQGLISAGWNGALMIKEVAPDGQKLGQCAGTSDSGAQGIRSHRFDVLTLGAPAVSRNGKYIWKSSNHMGFLFSRTTVLQSNFQNMDHNFKQFQVIQQQSRCADELG